MTERHGYRIAVIMNEFGDTAVHTLHPILPSLTCIFFRISKVRKSFFSIMLIYTSRSSAKAIKIPSAENPDNLEQASEEFLELANGCLCCSIKDTGVAAIEKLMMRKGVFDHILLETTGLADPGQ